LTRSTAGSSRHLPALDGLRGAAVLGVIAYHAGHLTGGYLGVDLFFVLSGFLITRLLLDEHRRTGSIDLKHFWSRRARRLLPAVLLVIVAVAVYSAFVARPSELGQLRADSVSTLFYVANWNTIVTNQSYWAQFGAPSPLQHAWSLAIEEQFYVLWPLVCIAVLGRRRKATMPTLAASDARGSTGAIGAPDAKDAHRSRGPHRLLVLSLGGAAVSATIMITGYAPGVETTRLYVGTDTRVAAILLGAALACAVGIYGDVRGQVGRRVLEGAGWIATFALAVAWVLLEGHDPLLYQGGLLACGVGVTIVIAAVTQPIAGPLARLFSLSPLRFAGRISYGLYLWHWPIFTWLTVDRTGLAEPVLLPLQLALTLGISLLSYKVIEMPIRRGAMPPTLARRAGPGFVAVAFLAVLVATVPPVTGVSAEMAAQLVTPLGPLPGAKHQPARVLIVGDSVGDSVTRTVVPEQSRFGVEIESLAVPGCGFVRSNPAIHYLDGSLGDETACLAQHARWTARIDEWQPDVVIAIFGWVGNTERLVEGAWRRPCDPVFDAWFEGEAAAMLDTLNRGHARVFLTTAPYMRAANAPPDSDRSTDCLNRLYTGNLTASRRVGIVDLASHVCPDGICRTELEGEELRPDGLHFEGAASLWAGDWILHQAWAASGSTSPR